MSGQFAELESLLGFTAALDSGKTEEIYASVATHIGAIGASKIAEAVVELQAAGLDPSMYIAPSKAYQRRQRELARLKPEQLAAQREQDVHDMDMRERMLKLREKEAAVQLSELTVQQAQSKANVTS